MSGEAPAAGPAQPEETLAQLGIAPGSGDQGRKNEEPLAEPESQPIPITPPPAPTIPE